MDFGATEVPAIASAVAADEAAAGAGAVFSEWAGASAAASAASSWALPSFALPTFTTTQLAGASLATTALGTISQVAGNIQSGNAARDAALYRAQVARNNAAIAEGNAQFARTEGERLAGLQLEKGAALKDRQRVAYAASGIDPNQGSALLVQEDTDKLAKEDAYTIRSNAARKAAGYETDQFDFDAQAALDEAAGGNANLAKWLNATTSVLGGASSVSDKWAAYKAKGIPGFA